MSDACSIRQAVLPGDSEGWGCLRHALWPDEDGVVGIESLHAALEPTDDACVLLAIAPDGEAVGFAEAKLRRDYVNGTDSSPVGFLEGWYVAPAWLGRGIGRDLIAGIEAWALASGCSELASDALLENQSAHAAHLGCGFEQTDRVVYFRKQLLP